MHTDFLLRLSSCFQEQILDNIPTNYRFDDDGNPHLAGLGYRYPAKEEKQDADVQTGDLETLNHLQTPQQQEAKGPGRRCPTTLSQR